MGSISSGIGLISGLDIEALVTQLISIDARPRELLKNRIEQLTAQQAGLLGIQARVLAIRLAAVNFNKDDVFKQKTATSTNEDVLTVSPSRFSIDGSYRFQVKRLASNHQLMSGLYSSRTSFVGSGQMSFEIGHGQLARATDLSFINGQSGFDRGGLEITDKSGAKAKIDLSAALTMTDVLEAINSNETVNVTARVSGDHVIIEDLTGENGKLFIKGSSAESLGIATGVMGLVGSQMDGRDLLSVTGDTLLSQLNDGNGVRMGILSDLSFQLKDHVDITNPSVIDVDLKAKMHEVSGAAEQSTRLAALNSGGGVRLGKIRITDRNKRSVEIDLSTLGPNATMGQLKEYIEAEAIAAGLVDTSDPDAPKSTIVMQFGSSDHITMQDKSVLVGSGDRKSEFIIEDIDGGFAAADLGIAQSIDNASITGDPVYRMETLGDVINAINNHYDNDGSLVASINAAGTGLSVVDSSGGAGQLVISSTHGTADDLGILTTGSGGSLEGRRLIAGLNTVMLRSLNGGNAANPGRRITSGGDLDLADGDGNTASLDLSQAVSVQDVIDAINGSGTNIRASLNTTGNGLVLNDHSTSFTYMEVSGNLAKDLGIDVSAAVSSVESGNLELQYISESSRLEDLRQGRGVAEGKFSITTSAGQRININIDNDKTLGDVIDTINIHAGITAKINATGDGIVITEDDPTVGGTLEIKETDGGTTAHDLGILGKAKAGENFIDGSYELKFDIGGGDSLEDIVSRVNAADMGVTASIINVGGSQYRLSFSSDTSGSAGVIYMDGGTTTLQTKVLSQGQDALLLNNSLLVRSSSNEVKDVIKGTTIELHAVSDEVVDITIAQDVEGVVAQMQNFVEAYNTAMDDIDELTRFDPESLDRGLLFGDSTVHQIKRRLQSMIQRPVPGLPREMNQLVQIGVKFASAATETGADGEIRVIARTPRLQLNEDDFREALAENPDGVMELFTKAEVGLGDYIASQLDTLAGQHEGTIKNRVDAINRRQDLFKDRVERLDDRLSRKEDRLYKQFYAMEQALASMQSQQSALSSLSAMATASRSRN